MNSSLVCDKIAEAAKTHVFQSQCHSPVGEIFLMELSLDDMASPQSHQTGNTHGTQPGLTGRGCLEASHHFSNWRSRLSVRFQYLSENIKQFESNTIWKALGGSHYLRTCHQEEKPTLISEGTEASQVSWNDSPAAWQSAAPPCCSSSLVTFSL